MNDKDELLINERWKVFGLDTFDACSRADTPGAGWYLINEFDSENKALACSAEKLSAYHPKKHITDKIFLVTPDGKQFRCVLPPCPDCELADSMRRIRNAPWRYWRRSSQAQFECEECGLKEWREVNHILLVEWKIELGILIPVSD